MFGTSLNRDFDEAYQGRSNLGSRLPWDIGEPQPEMVRLARSGRVHGRVLDSGCGTGENTLLFASLGHSVTGVDISPAAVELARRKATERRLDATFLVDDMLQPARLNDEEFDSIIDCGVMHLFDEADRSRYIRTLERVCRVGGRLFMLELASPGHAAMQQLLGRMGVATSASHVVRSALSTAFGASWAVRSVEPATSKVYRPGQSVATLMSAWLIQVDRVASEI